MKVNFADGKGPGDDMVARALKTEMDRWRPGRGPDWTDLLWRASRLPPRPVVLALSSAVLVMVLLTAVVFMTTVDVGPLANNLSAPAQLGR